MSWGDNGAARPSTEEYKNGYDRIFGRKSNAVETETESTERSGDGAPAKEHASSDRVGSACGADRNKNNGDDE